MKITKAIIPAAGLGTRFFPFTKAMPKEMMNIIDKPAIQFAVEELVYSGIEDILIITAKNSGPILNHFDVNPELDQIFLKNQNEGLFETFTQLAESCRIHSIRQSSASGIGQAVHRGKGFIHNSPFLVSLCDEILVDTDTPIITQMLDIHHQTGRSVIAIQEVPVEQSINYGMVQVRRRDDQLLQVQQIVEKPDPKNSPGSFAAIGRYLLTPSIFESLEKIPRGKNNEYQLTDAISDLLYREEIFAVVFKGKRYDVGNKLGYLQATVELALKHPDLREDFLKYLQILKGEIS